jgi:glycosyltransferase involved in cell wall biosynthesis
MKVCFVIDSLGSGGAERSTAVMLPYLRDRGVDASVITLYRATEGNEDEVRNSGFPVRVLRETSVTGRAREVRRLIKSERPDILHTALFASDQVGRLAALGTQTKVITSLVNTPRTARPAWGVGPAPWKVRVVNAVDLITSHLLVDRFHAVTPGVARAFEKKYHLRARRITVVERGRSPVDLGERTDERRSRVRKSLCIDPGAEVVLAAGRHDFQKAHVDLIRAIADLVAARPDILLLIAGREGEATEEIKMELAATRGLNDHVRLLGFRPDVPDLLVAADVMALSSRFEGTAGIALEAMALGTPIASTRLDGMDGVLVAGSNALIVPIGEPAAMATAIARLLDDRELAAELAATAQRDFLERFTIDRAADRMVAMYRDLVG